MDNQDQQKPTKTYSKHPLRLWVSLYVVLAVIIYALIYLFLIHKGGPSITSSASGSGFGY